jgi:phosphohistidine phosphatase SixA
LFQSFLLVTHLPVVGNLQKMLAAFRFLTAAIIYQAGRAYKKEGKK